MEKKYMVVSYGVSKEKKEPYSRAYRIAGDRKGTFSYLDAKDVYYVSDQRELGTVITVEVKEI